MADSIPSSKANRHGGRSFMLAGVLWLCLGSSIANAELSVEIPPSGLADASSLRLGHLASVTEQARPEVGRPNPSAETELPSLSVIAAAKVSDEAKARTSTPASESLPADSRAETLEEVEVSDRQTRDGPWQLPISNIEFEGIELQQRDIVDLTTLSEKVLGFLYSESIVSSDRFFVRGLGTIGTNPGFDQAVGLSLDGLNLARSRFGRTSFLDLQSAVLFKSAVNQASTKNSPAGHLQLNTVDAEPNFNGYVSVFQHINAAPGTAIDAASNFRLSSRWSMRLATRIEFRDGWVDNPSIGQSGQQKRDWTLRAKWKGFLHGDRELELMYQFGMLNRQGRNRELLGCLAQSARDDCVLDRRRFGVPTAYGGTGTGIEFFNTGYHLFVFDLSKAKDRGLARHLFNFASYNADDYYDADQSYVRQDHSLVSTGENYGQIDYEYRWQTQRDHWFNFNLAVRTSASNIDFVEATILCGDDHDELGRVSALANCDDSTQPEFQGAQRNVDVRLSEFSLLYFNQFDFQLNRTWSIELSLRFSLVDKLIDGRAFLSEPWQAEQALRNPVSSEHINCLDYVENLRVTQQPGRQLVCHEPLRQHNLNYGSNNHLQPYLWQPSLSLLWTDRGQTVFLRASRSVKSFGYEVWPIVFGLGFNFIDGLSPLFPEQYMFRGEFTTTYELGGSHSWLNDTLLLKWSIWLTSISDLQVSNYDAFLQRNIVSNAAAASSRGIDLQWTYAFVPGHKLSLSAAYTLARYDSYLHAPCYENQTEVQGCIPFEEGAALFDILRRSQNLSGQDLEYAPRWQYALAYDGRLNLSALWWMDFSVNYYWRGSYFIGTAHHPDFDAQNPVSTLDARLAFGSDQWQIAVIGRNLLESYAASFAVSDAAHERVSVIGEPSTRIYTAFSRPGSEVALNLKYNW